MIRQLSSSPGMSPGLRIMLRHIAQDSDIVGAANETDGSSVDRPDADQVDPNDDPITQVMKFLQGKLNDDDMARLELILHPDITYDRASPKPIVTMDARLNAAGRRVRARLAVAERADMLKRFPQAGRLRQVF